MTENSKAFLRLILRSPDQGDGWRKVSKGLFSFIDAFPHPELLETKDNMVRLSERGLIVVDYI